MPRDVARLAWRGTRRRGRWCERGRPLRPCSGCPPRTFGLGGRARASTPALARLPSVPVHYKRARRAGCACPRSCGRPFWASPIGDGDAKDAATYRSETAMLAWSGCPQPFPSRRDREFESVLLLRGVCEPSVPKRRRPVCRQCASPGLWNGSPNRTNANEPPVRLRVEDIHGLLFRRDDARSSRHFNFCLYGWL
jgi:hypothetical protein